MRIALLLAFLSAPFIIGCSNTTKFDKASFSSDDQISKEAGSYWKHDGWWKFKKEPKKVAIIDFNVEYLTKTDEGMGNNQLGLLTVARIAGAGVKKFEFTEQMKEQLAEQLYQQYVAALKANGYDVIPRETVTANAVYKQIATNEKGESKWQSKQSYWNAANQTVEVYSAKNLNTIKHGIFGAIQNTNKEMQLAGALDADLAVGAHFRCGLDGGKATLGAGSRLAVYADPTKRWGGNDWSVDTHGAVVGTKNFLYDQVVIDQKEFKAFQGDVYTVNGDAYSKAVTEVFPTYAKMSIVKMKS